jgi:hypothetical protein
MRPRAAALAAAGLPSSEGNRSGCSMTLQSVARLLPPLNSVDPLQHPPVNGAAVALTADDPRCQVLVRAHERHGLHVCQLYVNSTAIGPPVSPTSLLDGFRLRRSRMHGMKAVLEQEEEGRLGAGGRRASPIEESPTPIVELSTPAASVAA